MSWEWDLQINFIINRTFKHYLTVCFVLWLAAFIMQTARCIENTAQFLRASRQWRSRSQWGHRGRNIYWFLNPSVDNEWTHILKSDCFHDEVPLEKKKNLFSYHLERRYKQRSGGLELQFASISLCKQPEQHGQGSLYCYFLCFSQIHHVYCWIVCEEGAVFPWIK